MRLVHLQRLRRDMVTKGIPRQRWIHRDGPNVIFTVIYIADVTPWNLSFTRHQRNVFLQFNIDERFTLPSLLDPVTYRTLATALRTHGLSGRPLVPSDFFSRFDARINPTAQTSRVPSYEEIASARPDIEEAEKVYFCGWRLNPSDHSVRRPNLNKTRYFLGDAAARWSAKNNASSCWTDDPSKSLAPFVPE